MVTRYVITHVKGDMRTLTFAAQGWYTYATREEAEKDLVLWSKPGGLPRVLNEAEMKSLAVRPVECYEGHFDPTRIYFDD